MNIIVKTLGYIVSKFNGLLYRYQVEILKNQLGGGKRSIAYPFEISGISNIRTESPISIGPNSTIYTTKALLVIKKHFISGPNLTIITGDHHYMLGKFIDQISDEEKTADNDKDVVIEEDVWCGANVTILKGVNIGRGCIIAAGAVVVNSAPPYSIVGGLPARCLKFRFTIEQILEHEKMLYPEEERYTREQLEEIFSMYQK